MTVICPHCKGETTYRGKPNVVIYRWCSSCRIEKENREAKAVFSKGGFLLRSKSQLALILK
jgi:hypothetical protein